MIYLAHFSFIVTSRIYCLEEATESFSGESTHAFGHHPPELFAHVGGLPDVAASHGVPEVLGSGHGVAHLRTKVRSQETHFCVFSST